MAKQDNTTKKILYSIAVLVIIFFALLILSSSVNVDTKYSYVDEIQTKNEYEYENKIGEITLTNNGILPARVELKSLRGCLFESIQYPSDIYISYRGAFSSYYDGYRKYSYDISSGDEEKIDINLEYFPRKLNPQKEEIQNQNMTLYLFEVDKGLDNYYNFCNNAKKEDAFKTIIIKIE